VDHAGRRGGPAREPGRCDPSRRWRWRPRRRFPWRIARPRASAGEGPPCLQRAGHRHHGRRATPRAGCAVRLGVAWPRAHPPPGEAFGSTRVSIIERSRRPLPARTVATRDRAPSPYAKGLCQPRSGQLSTPHEKSVRGASGPGLAGPATSHGGRPPALRTAPGPDGAAGGSHRLRPVGYRQSTPSSPTRRPMPTRARHETIRETGGEVECRTHITAKHHAQGSQRRRRERTRQRTMRTLARPSVGAGQGAGIPGPWFWRQLGAPRRGTSSSTCVAAEHGP
jgi:hypothetical protein